MAEVEVIKASEGTVNRRRDTIGKGLTLERQRVAAYVRVSTDGEEHCGVSSAPNRPRPT